MCVGGGGGRGCHSSNYYSNLLSLYLVILCLQQNGIQGGFYFYDFIDGETGSQKSEMNGLSHTGFDVAEPGFLISGTVLFEPWRCFYLLLFHTPQKQFGRDTVAIKT